MAPTKELSTQTNANIFGLKEAGFQTKKISKLVGMAKFTVRKWCARYRDGNSATAPSQKSRSGRPRKTSASAVNIVKRALEAEPRATARLLKEGNRDLFTDVSVRTISRRVHELGYKSHKSVSKPLLTRAQRAKRVVFADKYLTWSEDDWLSVLCSD